MLLPTHFFLRGHTKLYILNFTLCWKVWLLETSLARIPITNPALPPTKTSYLPLYWLVNGDHQKLFMIIIPTYLGSIIRYTLKNQGPIFCIASAWDSFPGSFFLYLAILSPKGATPSRLRLLPQRRVDFQFEKKPIFVMGTSNQSHSTTLFFFQKQAV